MKRSIVVADVGLIALVAMLGWHTGKRALRSAVPDMPEAMVPAQVVVPADRAREQRMGEQEVVEAVASNPFSPARKPAERRFSVLPSAMDGRIRQSPPPHELAMRLAGTSVVPGGKAFAMLAIGDQPPRLVREADDVQGWQVTAIERGLVRLRRGRDTMTMQLQAAQ